MLSVKPSSAADAAIGAFAEATKLRLEAVPPGTCPIAMVTAHAELCASQTCGKCVPCREGLPQLAALLARIRDCAATPEDLAAARTLATMIRDASDCVIGYKTGADVLESMELFASEYAAHTQERFCAEDIG